MRQSQILKTELILYREQENRRRCREMRHLFIF
jgi:hypothetical protein